MNILHLILLYGNDNYSSNNNNHQVIWMFNWICSRRRINSLYYFLSFCILNNASSITTPEETFRRLLTLSSRPFTLFPLSCFIFVAWSNINGTTVLIGLPIPVVDRIHWWQWYLYLVMNKKKKQPGTISKKWMNTWNIS